MQLSPNFFLICALISAVMLFGGCGGGPDDMPNENVSSVSASSNSEGSPGKCDEDGIWTTPVKK